MRELLGEFRSLYQERLHRLEALTDGREETLELKVQILQSYINDLSEQNDVLIQAMEEHEREANRRVVALEKDLQDLRLKLGTCEEDVLKLQLENTTLKTENCNLRTVLQHTRSRQFSSVMLCAMPTEHLSGSTATLPPTNSDDIMMEYEEVKSQMAAKEQMIQSLQTQLREAVYQQQQSKYEVVNKDQKIQELQDTITELHNEMAVKDTEKLNQLQDIHHLESKIKALKQLGSPHSTQENEIMSFRANSLLKLELERRDDTILHLRKEVLLLQEKRDELTAELDVQEKKIYHLQAQLREGEAKLEQKQSCLQQLKEELETTKRLHKEVQKQFADNKEFLVQVEDENKALKASSLEYSTEIAKLTATIQDLKLNSQKAKSALTAEAAQRSKELLSAREELEEKLSETLAELSEKERTIYNLRVQVQDANLWAEETKVRLEEVDAEMKTMKTKYNLAMNEVAVKAEQLRIINGVHEDLKVTAAQYEERIHEMESKLCQKQNNQDQAKDKMTRLEQIIKQLEDERARLQEHCHELTEENGQLHVQLEMENLAVQTEQNMMSTELRRKEGLIHKLKNERIVMQDKANETKETVFQFELQMEHLRQQLKAAEMERDDSIKAMQNLERQLQDYRSLHLESTKEVHQCEDTIRQLNAELLSIHNTQDSVEKRSAQKDELIYQLQNEIQTLHSEILELQSKVSNREEKLSTLQSSRENLQHQYSSCYSELLLKKDNLEKVKKELEAATEESIQRALQLSNFTLEKQKLDMDLTVLHEKNKASEQEIHIRDQTILKLESELKTAEENLRNAKEELTLQQGVAANLKAKVKTLQAEEQNLREACREHDKKMRQQEKALQDLQHEKIISDQQNQNQERSIYQLQKELEVLKHTHECGVDHFTHESARLRKELHSSSKELQDKMTKLQQYKSTVDRLNSDLQNAEEQHQEMLHEISQFKDIVHKQELEMAQFRQQQLDSENQIATVNEKCKSLETKLDLYKQKHQTSVNKMTELESAKQQLQADLQDKNKQLCSQDEIHQKLRNELITVKHQCENKCRQVENCEDAIDNLTQQLQAAQKDLSAHRVHGVQCEEVIRSLRNQAAVHHNEAASWEENVVKLQADFASYKATHSHADTEYNFQCAHLEQLKKDFAQANTQNSEYFQEIKKYQEIMHKMNLQLTTVTEQKDNEITHLEKFAQNLQLDKASDLQKHQMETAKLGQQIMKLENDLHNCQKLCTQQEQAIQKRDDLLRKSEADLLQARDSIKGKVREIEKQGSMVKALTMDLQRLGKEMQQKENDINSIKTEREQLKQDLQKTNKQRRELAQELAHKEEKLLLMENSLQTSQHQLSDRIAETVRHEQANWKLQSELKALKELSVKNQKEKEYYRTQIEKLKVENAQHKQSQENTVREELMHQQSIYKMEIEVNSCREQIKTLQDQIQQREEERNRLQEELKIEQTRKQDLQRHFQKMKDQLGELERETENQNAKLKANVLVLREREDRILSLENSLANLQKKHQVLCNKYKNCESELQNAQKNVLSSHKQSEYYAEEVTRHEDAVAKLQSQLDIVQGQAQKTKHELMSANKLIYDLKLELTTCQGAQKENTEQLSEKSREIASLKNDIACNRQRNMQLAEESTIYEERIKRLQGELKKVQELNRRAEEEAHIYENRLMELSSQVMLSQRKTHETMKELTSKEEELVMTKVELTSLRERYHSKAEELETLRKSLHGARSDSSRLHRESELVVANVNQWVKDQKQTNEKLGNKIKEQTKQILQLSTEKDHLQETNERLQQENKKLRVEMNEKRITNERLKALHSYSTEDPRVMRQLQSQLHDEDSFRTMKRTYSSTENTRKPKSLAANWTCN
ncbi:uncharacterized protein pmfbp1 [Hemitrygon akajei]|uniref:uncharacterized protein pmfbp1 n=1 Tax=Hemitrygon akajei TaxID=2704970 RepID=UPI003BF9D723